MLMRSLMWFLLAFMAKVGTDLQFVGSFLKRSCAIWQLRDE